MPFSVLQKCLSNRRGTGCELGDKKLDNLIDHLVWLRTIKSIFSLEWFDVGLVAIIFSNDCHVGLLKFGAYCLI